jgi:hypothetical protein
MIGLFIKRGLVLGADVLAPGAGACQGDWRIGVRGGYRDCCTRLFPVNWLMANEPSLCPPPPRRSYSTPGP